MPHSVPSGYHSPVAPGDVLVDKYRVERVLGAGGMGVVVAATHLELQEQVAVKFLHPEAIESPEAAARFLREARVAVKIRSENVARVIDVGRLENGAPYMVMEYLEGEDLAAQVLRGPLPLETAVDYVIQACSAMAEAHKVGVVHRDLKPANLFVVRGSDGSPVIKVLDFGISKLSVPDLSEAGLTKTSTMMGSPYYMSPEQMRSARDVDVRTDVWALGVILFELLTAQNAFGGTSLPELVANIMTVGPRSLKDMRPGVPDGLCRVVYRCLEKDPAQRFQNVADLAQALVPFAVGRDAQITVERLSRVMGVTPLVAQSASAPPAASALGATNTSWSETKKATGTRRSLLVGGGALAALGLASAVWFALSSSAVATSIPSAEPAKLAAPPATPVPADQARQVNVPPNPRPAHSAPAPAEVTAAPALVEESARAAATEPEPGPAGPRTRSTSPRSKKPATPTPAPAPENKPAAAVKNPLNIELK
ncbi:MAG TPA: serine/threonine-protein kinase [Polyangiaceae bacterium]|nr:serine/threonine-protein kinase [Polyangiaceae bacterium]